MHWADEVPVSEETDVHCVWAAGFAVKLARIKFNGDVRQRVTIGSPLGSQSAHFDSIAHATQAVERFVRYSEQLHEQVNAFSAPGQTAEQQAVFASVRTLFKSDMPGCLFVEPRGFPTWGTDVVPSEQWINPQLPYETRDGRKIAGLEVRLAAHGTLTQEVTFPVKCSILRPGKAPEYATYLLTGRRDLFYEQDSDLVLTREPQIIARPSYAVWRELLDARVVQVTDATWAELCTNALLAKQWYIDGESINKLVDDYVAKHNLVTVE